VLPCTAGLDDQGDRAIPPVTIKHMPVASFTQSSNKARKEALRVRYREFLNLADFRSRPMRV
jgi:hypothetical protein